MAPHTAGAVPWVEASPCVVHNPGQKQWNQRALTTRDGNRPGLELG